MSPTANDPRATALQAILIWLLTGVLITAPIWLTLGIRGLPLALLGPAGLLLFKPGENLLPKLGLALLISSPTIAGLTLLIWKWSNLAPTRRLLSVAALSVLWHGVGAGLWLLILNGFN